MKALFAAVLLVCAGLAAAADAPTTFPMGYWERGYGYNPNAASTYYNLSLRVKDTQKAAAEIDRRMAKAGASLINLNNSYVFQNTAGQGAQRQRARSMSYSVAESKAEGLAKSLFPLGELQQYNSQKVQASNQLEEIEQKLKLVDAELEKHKDALKDSPPTPAERSPAAARYGSFSISWTGWISQSV